MMSKVLAKYFKNKSELILVRESRLGLVENDLRYILRGLKK